MKFHLDYAAEEAREHRRWDNIRPYLWIAWAAFYLGLAGFLSYVYSMRWTAKEPVWLLLGVIFFLVHQMGRLRGREEISAARTSDVGHMIAMFAQSNACRKLIGEVLSSANGREDENNEAEVRVGSAWLLDCQIRPNLTAPPRHYLFSCSSSWSFPTFIEKDGERVSLYKSPDVDEGQVGGEHTVKGLFMGETVETLESLRKEEVALEKLAQEVPDSNNGRLIPQYKASLEIVRKKIKAHKVKGTKD